MAFCINTKRLRTVIPPKYLCYVQTLTSAAEDTEASPIYHVLPRSLNLNNFQMRMDVYGMNHFVKWLKSTTSLALICSNTSECTRLQVSPSLEPRGDCMFT